MFRHLYRLHFNLVQGKETLCIKLVANVYAIKEFCYERLAQNKTDLLLKNVLEILLTLQLYMVVMQTILN